LLPVTPAPLGEGLHAGGGCLCFAYLGVVLRPLPFNGVLALTGTCSAAFALLSVPALAVGARLPARMPAR